jgi:hypothetical protein
MEARLVGSHPDRAPVDDGDALAGELGRCPLEPVAGALGLGGDGGLEGLDEESGRVDEARLRSLELGA